MQATAKEIEILKRLQEVDTARLRAQMNLEKLPQPAKAAQIREKMEELVLKLTQVQDMLFKAENQLEKYQSEDMQLVDKINECQKSIEESMDDYRSVNALTRDLEGMQKRRETIEFESEKLLQRSEEIHSVIESITQAQENLATQEQNLANEYHMQGLTLKSIVQEAEEKRQSFLAALHQELAQEYERAMKRCGGVAIAELEGKTCSACRNVLPDGRVAQMQQEAPISFCPNCKRLVVI